MTIDDIAKIVLPWRAYLYLGSPFTKYPHGHAAAVAEINRIARLLMLRGVPIYVPVSHSSAVLTAGELPYDHEFWMAQCLPLVRGAYGLVAVTMDGWKESRGLQEEIVEAKALGKPIWFMQVPPC